MALLKDKIALVTGGSSGIGRATSMLFAKEGATVILTDIQEEAGKETAKIINEDGGDAHFYSHDVTDEQAWSEVISSIKNKFGGLHCLVNNAGIGVGKQILDTSLEDFRHMFAVNMESIFIGTKNTLELIHESGGGTIVNISSVAGLRGAPGLSTYCATKGAVRLYTKAVALEAAQNGLQVRCNSVHPGIIQTPIWDSVIDSDADDATQGLMGLAMRQAEDMGLDLTNLSQPELVALLRVPGGKVGQAHDVAKIILFLSSDQSSYVNGAELVVDSGLTSGT